MIPLNKKEEFQKGMELCLENYYSWINEADLLYNRGSYGHAYALYFHGMESLVQFFYCWMVASGIITIENKEFNEVFRIHSIKLDFVYSLMVFIKTKALIDFNYEGIRDKIYTEKEIEKELEVYEDYNKKYRKNMMKSRNEGIYVNYENGDFNSPLEIKKRIVDDFKKEIEILDHVVINLVKNATKKDISLIKRVLTLF